MNLGKRILGAVSAGALVLSMSALSAFAAGSIQTITLGGTGKIQVDTKDVITNFDPADAKFYYDGPSGSTPTTASTDLPGNATVSIAGGKATITFGTPLATDTNMNVGIELKAVSTGDLTLSGTAFKAFLADGSTPANATMDEANFSASFSRKTKSPTIAFGNITGLAGMSSVTADAKATDPLTGIDHNVTGVTVTPSNGQASFTGLKQGLSYVFTVKGLTGNKTATTAATKITSTFGNSTESINVTNDPFGPVSLEVFLEADGAAEGSSGITIQDGSSSTVTATGTDSTGDVHTVSVKFGSGTASAEFKGANALKTGYTYTFELTTKDGKGYISEGSGTVIPAGTIKLKGTYKAAVGNTLDPLIIPGTAFFNEVKTLVAPTGKQVRAPLSPVIPVATGNNAQNYIISELKNNTNYAGAIAGSNASNYFKDAKAAQAGAKYTEVFKVDTNASFNPSMTPEQYLDFVNANYALDPTSGITANNTRYVVKVTFPIETVNTDKYTPDIILNFVGTEGAPNQNSGIPQENTVLSNGNKVVSSNISNLVSRLNSGNLSSAPLLTLTDKNGKTIASFNINATGKVTEDNVKAAVDALSTLIVGSNNATGNNAWNAFVKENPDAKSYAFQFTKDATFKNFTVSVTMNNMPSGVASGTVYKEVNGKMAEQGNYSVSGNSSSFTLKGCSNYRLVYGKLSSVVLAAGEGTTDSADDVVAETTVDEANVPETLPLVNNEAPVAEISTVAAVNPSTGNAPIALAVIPVAIAAAVVIAKKSR